MHSAIIYAVLAESPRHEERQQVAILLATVEKLELNGSIVRLGEFVWQTNFREFPAGLSRLVAACEQQAIPYRILPLDAEPQWIRGDPSL